MPVSAKQPTLAGRGGTSNIVAWLRNSPFRCDREHSLMGKHSIEARMWFANTYSYLRTRRQEPYPHATPYIILGRDVSANGSNFPLYRASDGPSIPAQYCSTSATSRLMATGSVVPCIARHSRRWLPLVLHDSPHKQERLRGADRKVTEAHKNSPAQEPQSVDLQLPQPRYTRCCPAVAQSPRCRST